MPVISYPYDRPDPDSAPAPIVQVIVVNLLTGKSTEVDALVDSGADKTTFNYKVMSLLELTMDDITKTDLISVAGKLEGGFWLCNHLAIAIMDRAGTPHFPAGEQQAVPAGFAPMQHECLLGRDAFLDLMKVTFDGPRGVVRFEF